MAPTLPIFIPPTSTSPQHHPLISENGDLTGQFVDSFPKPAQFETLFDYEQGLLAWKQRIEVAVSGMRMPNVMGRKFCRPKVVEPNTIEDLTTIAIDPRRDLVVLESHARESTPSPSSPNQLSELENESAHTPTLKGFDYDENQDDDINTDPWVSVLVPQMPTPLDYDTFNDFEEALLRWTLICNALPFLPPHADRLQEIIPIVAPTPPGDILGGVGRDDLPISILPEPPVEWVRLVLSELPFFEPMKRRPLVPSNPYVPTMYPPIKDFGQLSESDRSQIERIFAKLHRRHDKPLLPIIHGTLPKPYANVAGGGDDGDLYGGGSGGGGSGGFSGGGSAFGVSGGGFGSPYKFSGGGGSTGSSPKHKVKTKMLRRTDLTKEMIEKCMDCLPEYDGVKVEFKIPMYELYNIDLQRIGTDSSYKDELQKQVVQMQHIDRSDSLNSWFYPTVGIETHRKHRACVERLMNASKFDVGVLSEILAGDMYIDQFQDLLSENCREEVDGSTVTYLQVFLSCVTPENFPHLLALFEKTESRLLHAKLAAFITETTQSTKGKVLCEKLILNRDVKSLSFVAYGMAFFNEVPVDIYPWHNDTYFAVKKFLGPAIEPLLIVFSYYYVNLICQAINKQSFLFVGLSPFMNEARKNLAAALGLALNSHPDFVGQFVFRGMAHRSQKISHMLLFVLVQLLTQQNTESPLVQKASSPRELFLSSQRIYFSNLRSEVTNLVNKTRDLTDSKYMHVRLTARRIFDILMNEPWQDYLYADYKANPDQLLRDMLRPAPRKGGVSTMCSIVLDLSISALKKVTNTDSSKKRIAFLLDEVVFHSVFQHVAKNAQAVDQSTVALATLLYHLAKTYYRMGQIAGNQSIKNSQRKTGSFTLTLTPPDIQKLLTFLADVKCADESVVVGVRRYMLATLKQLVKCHAIFDFVKKESEFYNRLLQFCRDGSVMMLQVNKQAWMILYVIIHYHAGTMDYLNKSNTIHSFLELIATYSPRTVITNGTHCITKLFCMLAIEQRKPKRKDIRPLAKDIKILTCIFIERHLFIKIHMIYKTFTPITPGIVFYAIANFYNVLQTTEGCKKLLKNTMKSVDYKEGLEVIRRMHNPMTSSEDSDSPLPTSRSATGFIKQTRHKMPTLKNTNF